MTCVASFSELSRNVLTQLCICNEEGVFAVILLIRVTPPPVQKCNRLAPRCINLHPIPPLLLPKIRLRSPSLLDCRLICIFVYPIRIRRSLHPSLLRVGFDIFVNRSGEFCVVKLTAFTYAEQIGTNNHQTCHLSPSSVPTSEQRRE